MYITLPMSVRLLALFFFLDQRHHYSVCFSVKMNYKSLFHLKVGTMLGYDMQWAVLISQVIREQKKKKY